ncbi:EAL domain-containing protein [Bacillus kexueae]|uniref:sensor domain-containing protein n=1 Tax=Aeribacillus kexueae TaxID=2078952 RepID=UPI001FAF9B02|nr:EAL domain-containing protein [Bacillus kexueae]
MKSKNPSLNIVVIYITLSGLWIFGSDWVLTQFIPNIELFETYMFSVMKGMAYVFLSGWFFYSLIHRNFISIQESEDRYRRLVEHSPEVILVHIKGKIVYVNDAGVRLARANSASEIIGRNIFDFVPEENREYIETRMRKVYAEGTISVDTVEIEVAGGKRVPVQTTAFKTSFERQTAIQVIIRDISEQKKSEEKVRYYAYYDVVTGLPNRHHLIEHIQKVKEKVIQENKGFSVMLLDLDRFKIINDTLGHDVGDQLLKEVSNRLVTCLEEKTFISRFGGDEYVIVIESTDEDVVGKVAKKIITELSIPFQLNQNEVYITPSVGISMFPVDGYEIDSLIKKADIAMYSVKQKGRNDFSFFDSRLFEKHHRKMSLEHDLRKAIDYDELFLVYQPQIELSTGKIIGVEALVRWKHPNLGIISPNEFIPIAEETGQIGFIGEWILKTACAQLKEWEDLGLQDIQVSVNVSVHQFLNQRFVAMVEEVLNETNVNPVCLQLEITESFVQNLEESVIMIEKLKELGLKIAIDDFGKGYSSLSVLKNLPVDHLKIDRSFINDIDTDGKELMKTIIQMGRGMNFTIVAEGVEEKTQADFLKDHECHIGQGYYFSKPLEQHEMVRLLKEEKIFN